MTTTYTFEQLKEDVRKEAEALRVHATSEERAKLDLTILKPSNMNKCIYGQMTGNCYSDRAASLIQKCCVRFFEHDVMPTMWSGGVTMDDIKKHVNGRKVKGFRKDRAAQKRDIQFSAIEAYILLPEAKNANLIAFIKGETDNLEL